MKRTLLVLPALSLLLCAVDARAELWHPLDTTPKPNVVVAVDHSVTMAITPDCTRCHRDGLGGNPSRLQEVKAELASVMPIFKDYFQYSAFTYSACGSARITNRSPIPVSTNLTTAYNDAINVINTAGHCSNSESSWPSGSGSGTATCLTPTLGCSGDGAAISAIFSYNSPPDVGLVGLSIPVATMTSTICDLTGLPYDLGASLMIKMAGGAFTWPRWSGANTPPTPTQVTNDFCTPLESVLTSISTELNTCSSRPSGIWDLSFLGGALASWCNPGNIQSNVCSLPPGSGGLRDTCTCDMTNPGCDLGGGGLFSDCGKPLSWKARQQVAVCESYDTAAGRFGRMFLNQPDNRVVPGGCRENVSLFMTDGYMGYTAGVFAEAAGAQPAYGSTTVPGLSNMYVFRISNVFNSHADAMAKAVANDPTMTAFDATNVNQMTGAFASVLSRIYKGVYVGARFGMDDIQSMAFVHSVTVPGANGAPPVDDAYLGFPTRLSAYTVNAATGALSAAPVWETDWLAKAGTAAGCYNNIGGTDVARLGPGGTFGNGVARNQSVNSGNIDRDGNGTLDATPGTAQIRFGRMFGLASSKPVLVGYPGEAAPNGNNLTWAAHRTAIRTRPQVAYFSDGGYVYGIHAGAYSAAPTVYGFTSRGYSYNQGVAQAGMETLRYRPSWLTDSEATYDYNLNAWVTQPMLTGDLIAQEVFIEAPVPRWATLLIGSQGKTGRGYFAMDVTNPCAPTLFREWTLPSGAKASAAPTLHYVKKAGGGFAPVVVTVGGLTGPNEFYVYNLETGGMLTYSLGGGADYIAAPACVSSKGGQAIDVCYFLREDGYLARAEIGVGGALVGGVTNATPRSGGVPLSMTSGEVFTTSPLVYFDSVGRVNIVFGGGDFRNLTSAAGPNYLYRAVDPSNRQSAPATPTLDGVCTPNPATVGRIAFGAGERLISAPSIANGIVAVATYRTSSSGCTAGTGFLYAMNAETCVDAVNPANMRPAPIGVGGGIPTSPSLHRNSGRLLIGGSAKPTGNLVSTAGTTNPRGLRPVTKRLYFRVDQNLR